MPEGTPSGLRLGSYIVRKDGTLTPKLDAVKEGANEEEHGMPHVPEQLRSRIPQNEIRQLIIITLHDSGQTQYLLNENNAGIFQTHDVIVDADCQFDRTVVVGFHKDSRGTTAFVNPTFSNEQEISGAEYCEDVTSDPGMEERLPPDQWVIAAAARRTRKMSAWCPRRSGCGSADAHGHGRGYQRRSCFYRRGSSRLPLRAE